jgi:hypothetical protein
MKGGVKDIHFDADGLSCPKSLQTFGRNVTLPIPRSTIRTGPTLLSARSSKTRGPSDDVLLVDRRWYELEPVKPHHVLHVVAVGPEGVEVAGRCGRHVGVIPKEAAVEPVAGVDGMRAYDIRHVCCDVASKVVEARVVDVIAEHVTRDATDRVSRSGSTRLPRRNEGGAHARRGGY